MADLQTFVLQEEFGTVGIGCKAMYMRMCMRITLVVVAVTATTANGNRQDCQ
jgi:hypothetical protein